MNVWIRRLLMLFFVLFWLVLILTPTLAFVLARNGQVQVGSSEGPHWRLFLVQEADAEGIGLERSRVVPPPLEAPPGVECLRTTVSYWMWHGDGPAVAYCQCAETTTGTIVDATPPACLLP